MIDIHAHILPGIDDGPATMDESVEICRMAASNGTTTIVATPHFNAGTYETTSAKIFELINELEARLEQEKINLRILPGAEVLLSPELITYVKKEEYLTINRSGKYVLVELPPHLVPPHWDTFLMTMIDAGIVPILAHPERNAWFLNNPTALYQVVTKGAMVQMTAMSITGKFGEDIQRFSIFLLEHNLAHVIATDTHSTFYRPPLLREAVKIAEDVIGKEKANDLVTTMPAAIIDGREVSLPPPVEFQQKKVNTWLQRLAPFLKT